MQEEIEQKSFNIMISTTQLDKTPRKYRARMLISNPDVCNGPMSTTIRTLSKPAPNNKSTQNKAVCP